MYSLQMKHIVYDSKRNDTKIIWNIKKIEFLLSGTSQLTAQMNSYFSIMFPKIFKRYNISTTDI